MYNIHFHPQSRSPQTCVEVHTHSCDVSALPGRFCGLTQSRQSGCRGPAYRSLSQPCTSPTSVKRVCVCVCVCVCVFVGEIALLLHNEMSLCNNNALCTVGEIELCFVFLCALLTVQVCRLSARCGERQWVGEMQWVGKATSCSGH